MTFDTNAAIEAALEAGTTEKIVVDGHGNGALHVEGIHSAAPVLTGRPGLDYPFEVNASFDAVMIVRQNADFARGGFGGIFDFNYVV